MPEYKKGPTGDLVWDLNGHPLIDEREDAGYLIRRYHPRVEGLVARIERWTDMATSDAHWWSISRDNIVTVYGKDANSRIADPEDPGRIFSWLICGIRDDTGNGVLYDYKSADGVGVDLTRVHERNRGDRDDRRRTANRYPGTLLTAGRRWPPVGEVSSSPPQTPPVSLWATDSCVRWFSWS